MDTRDGISDLAVLTAVVELTPRRVNVPARRVFEHLQARPPTPAEWADLRLVILRLERDGLLRSDSDLMLEATPDGLIAVELLQASGQGHGSACQGDEGRGRPGTITDGLAGPAAPRQGRRSRRRPR